jgi:hypothetical protein
LGLLERCGCPSGDSGSSTPGSYGKMGELVVLRGEAGNVNFVF